MRNPEFYVRNALLFNRVRAFASFALVIAFFPQSVHGGRCMFVHTSSVHAKCFFMGFCSFLLHERGLSMNRNACIWFHFLPPFGAVNNRNN